MSKFTPEVMAVLCGECGHPVRFLWDPAHVWADGSAGPYRDMLPCEVCALREHVAELTAELVLLADWHHSENCSHGPEGRTACDLTERADRLASSKP